ncbi:MAG: FHA domain-containing protein [Thermoanaerobaculum sp.]|nr:FHA domain-containing protein [Thermoanaerobaculum sp.]MDW7967484.1 adenylate/guanylate cyclase domain-containing protein [Thermoanaerobaculum sp.]
MAELVWEEGGGGRKLTLEEGPIGIGRASDNAVTLKDFSVSRHHARLELRQGRWWVVDLGSTNGVKVNGNYVQEAALSHGDILHIGNFQLTFREKKDTASTTGTFLRPLAQFQKDFPLEEKGTDAAVAVSSRERVLQALAQVARTLLEVEELEPVLSKVVDAVFQQLPAERAYILLFNPQGEPQLRQARSRTGAALKEVPISQTILDLVVQQKVAVLTSDAQADERFSAGMSVRLHSIRSAMCVPLWHRDNVIGVLFVDTPLATGCFTSEHLDLLTALANYAAVAIERAQLNDFIREERRIRERLERYHSPAVVEAIVKERRSGAERHETREVTVLFADIVGFTARCAHMEPEAVAAFLNEFFSLASEAIFAFGGTLDKFIGDAVMAFFGAPLPQPDHAERAVRAALALQQGVEGWNRQRRQQGLDEVWVRVALNTGPVVVGEIGSVNRVDYTVLGNTVNVAARLEEQVAEAGQVVVGPGTFAALQELFPFTHLGDFKIRGLAKPVPAYLLERERCL